MRWNQTGWLMLILAFALAGVSCQNSDLLQPQDEGYSEEELSLDKAYGGFDTSDEQPGFGDPDIMSDVSADEPASDPVAMDAASDLSSGQIPAYVVRITWGKLEGDSTATEVIDWSGYAEINKGVLGVLRLIRFERQTDRLVLPRQSKQRIDFESQTSRHFDGLMLLIVDNDTTDLDGELTLQLGAYSRTLSFAELDSLDLLEQVDDAGNEVSIVSHGRYVNHFAGGFFAGRWIRMNERMGRFHGRWIDIMGNNSGFLKGIWGQNGRGRRVMFGKYIKMDGSFGGLLAGHWGYSPTDRMHGWLKGRWVSRNQQEMGRFRGVWKTGKPGDRRGFFHGRWNRKGKPEEQSEN